MTTTTADTYLNVALAERRSQHGRHLGAGVSEEEHVGGAPRDHVEHGGGGQAGPVDDLGPQVRFPDDVQLAVLVQLVCLHKPTGQACAVRAIIR